MLLAEPTAKIVVRTRRGLLLKVCAIITNMLVLVLAILLAFVAVPEVLSTNCDYDSYNIIIFLVCSTTIALVITFDTIVIIFLQDFHSPFANISFFLFLLCEIIMVADAFTMESEKLEPYLYFMIGCGVMFILLMIYIICVSEFYVEWKENVRIMQEREFISLISRDPSKAKYRDCYRMPLTGPLPAFLQTKSAGTPAKSAGTPVKAAGTPVTNKPSPPRDRNQPSTSRRPY